MSTAVPTIVQLSALPAAPKRIILHWTGGGATANSTDLAHYHYVVEQSGRVVAGTHPVSSNMRSLRSGDEYAAHTGGLNSFSVGVAFAGMKGAVIPASGRTSKFGPVPLIESQVRAGLAFVARLCREWKLDPLNKAQLFTHAEAWRLHRVRGTVNDQKTDILVLPFLPGLAPDMVGPWLRAETRKLFEALS